MAVFLVLFLRCNQSCYEERRRNGSPCLAWKTWWWEATDHACAFLKICAPNEARLQQFSALHHTLLQQAASFWRLNHEILITIFCHDKAPIYPSLCPSIYLQLNAALHSSVFTYKRLLQCWCLPYFLKIKHLLASTCGFWWAHHWPSNATQEWLLHSFDIFCREVWALLPHCLQQSIQSLRAGLPQVCSLMWGPIFHFLSLCAAWKPEEMTFT